MNKQPPWESHSEDRPASGAPDVDKAQHETPALPALDYSPSGEKHDAYAAWKHRSYRLMAIGGLAGFFGGQIQATAVHYQLWLETGSYLALGYLGLIQALPTLLLSLPAGHVADLMSRRKLIIVAYAIVVVSSAGLAAVSYCFADTPYYLPTLYGMILLNACTLTFARPARSAMLPQLIPAKVFPNAVTWNSSIFETSAMVGPALGGLVISIDVNLAYLVSCVFFAAALWYALLLPDLRAPRQEGERRAGWGDLLEGVRFVWRTKRMFGAMLTDLLAVLLGGAVFLLPVFATDILQVGPLGFGLLRAAPAVGALAMALVLAHLPPMKNAGRNFLIAVAGFGVATIGFGISKNFYLSMAMLTLVGACDNVSVVVRHSLVQLLTPDHMRGRVSAVNMVFIGSSNQLGGFESGVVAKLLGPVGGVVFGGIGTLATVLSISLAFPSLRRLDRLQDLKPEPTDRSVSLANKES